MIQYHKAHPMFHGPLVRVNDYECSYPRMELSDPIVTPCASLALPRCGICIKHVEGRIVRADPNHVLFTNRNEEFRIRHLACDCRDCGTEIGIQNELLSDVVRAHSERDAEHPDHLFAFTHGPVTPEICIAHRVMLAASHSGDPVETEEAAIGLLERIVHAAYAARLGHGHGRRADTRQAHHDLTENVKLWLATRYREVLSLNAIAKAVACSPCHLCRTFHRQTGLTLSRYIHRLRFNEAIERLAAGEEDLTRLALDLGFSSHSHFSAAFQREFDRPPSSVRSELARL